MTPLFWHLFTTCESSNDGKTLLAGGWEELI
jgi:hypothetical protein